MISLHPSSVLTAISWLLLLSKTQPSLSSCKPNLMSTSKKTIKLKSFIWTLKPCNQKRKRMSAVAKRLSCDEYKATAGQPFPYSLLTIVKWKSLTRKSSDKM